MNNSSLRKKFELSTGDMSYDKVRAEIINHVELKRDTVDKNVKQMELDAFGFDYGGESEPWYSEEDHWPIEDSDSHGPQFLEMNYFSKGKSKGKGKGYDWSKGGGKGKGH